MEKTIDIAEGLVVARFAPEADDFRVIAAEGFKSVVNFRTEAENPPLPPAQEAQAAQDAGLTYLHHPVAAEGLSAEVVDEFRAKLDQLPRPVLLHCASGKRAGAMGLMQMAAAEGLPGGAALEKGRAKGLDLPEPGIGAFVRGYLDGGA